MTQPTAYTREFNFQNYQATAPTTPLPGVHVDAELNRIKTTLDQIRVNLALIQRDDTALANESVGFDQLADEVVIGVNPPTTWVTLTAYVVNDTVFNSQKFYRCLVSHTSGTFATDLAAGKWVLIADFTLTQPASGISYDNTTSGLAGVTVQTAVDEIAASLASASSKPVVRAATTANISLSAPQTIDGVSVIAGDRVLAKNQATPSQNGIWVVAAGGWSRAIDMNTWAKVVGATVWVAEGTANADTGWLFTNNAGGTLGATSITLTQIVTVDATQTLTNKTLTTPTLTLKQSASPTPTAEGDMQWDTDDNAIVVGDGAAQKTFRANNWEHISTQTLSAVASWAQTGLSAYRDLRITGRLTPATDNVTCLVRTDANGGASYDTGAADYVYEIARATGGTVTSAAGAATGIFIADVGNIGNVAPESIWFTVDALDFNQAVQGVFLWQAGWLDPTTTVYTAHGQGRRADATARDAIQILFSSGNIASGSITIEGRRG